MHIGKHIKKLVICSISTISSDHFLHTFVCAGLNVTLLRFTPPMQPLPPPSNKALWGIMGGEQGRRWIPTIEIKQVKQLNFKPYSGSYFNNAQKLWNLGKFNLHVFDSQKKTQKSWTMKVTKKCTSSIGSHGWYMYLHEGLIFMVWVHVGKYTVRPMDPQWAMVIDVPLMLHHVPSYLYQLFSKVPAIFSSSTSVFNSKPWKKSPEESVKNNVAGT